MPLSLVNEMLIKLIVDELHRCHQRISVLETEISKLKLSEEKNKENIELISKKNLYQKILNSVSQAVNQNVDPKDLSEYIVDILYRNIFRINCAAIFFNEKDYTFLNTQMCHSKNREKILTQVIKQGQMTARFTFLIRKIMKIS